MRHQNRQTVQWKERTGIGALLLIIFATELAIMELLSPLFARLNPISCALLDASIVVISSFRSGISSSGRFPMTDRPRGLPAP